MEINSNMEKRTVLVYVITLFMKMVHSEILTYLSEWKYKAITGVNFCT